MWPMLLGARLMGVVRTRLTLKHAALFKRATAWRGRTGAPVLGRETAASKILEAAGAAGSYEWDVLV